MPFNKYKHIFFDLDNTLWDFNQNSVSAMKQTFAHYSIFGQNVDFEYFFELYSRNNKLLWNSYRNKTVTKKELIVKRFQDTFDELKIAGINPEEINNYYLGCMPNQNRLKNGAQEVLSYLKSKRYQLYIITNGFREVQYKKLQNSGIDTYFRKVFISEDIKMPKPAYEIFEYAVKSANAEKKRSIMIGDDWESDIIGALNFGIDAVFYNPLLTDVQETNITKSNQNNYFNISELVQLMNIL